MIMTSFVWQLNGNHVPWPCLFANGEIANAVLAATADTVSSTRNATDIATDKRHSERNLNPN